MKKLIIIPLIIAVSMLIAGCKNDYHKLEGMVWNTTFHVTYDGDKDLTDSIYTVLEEVSQSLNVFDENSLISRANNSDSIRIDNDFSTVHAMSVRINEESDGAFDPTLGPLIDAWGFGRGHTATSDTLCLDSLLEMTGIKKTSIRNSTLYKENPAIRFNFSAIAKGYGCDRIGEMLSRNGCESYLVEIGGEIRCSGESPSNDKWKVSIDKPILTDSVLHDSQCIIAVHDAGIATSGNYRNFHGSGNTVYGHTISTVTGRPIQTDVLSATVVAKTSMEADGLATAMMALGSEKSKSLADKTGVGVLLVLSNGDVWHNKAFNDLIISEP